MCVCVGGGGGELGVCITWDSSETPLNFLGRGGWGDYICIIEDLDNLSLIIEDALNL